MGDSAVAALRRDCRRDAGRQHHVSVRRHSAAACGGRRGGDDGDIVLVRRRAERLHGRRSRSPPAPRSPRSRLRGSASPAGSALHRFHPSLPASRSSCLKWSCIEAASVAGAPRYEVFVVAHMITFAVLLALTWRSGWRYVAPAAIVPAALALMDWHTRHPQPEAVDAAVHAWRGHLRGLCRLSLRARAPREPHPRSACRRHPRERPVLLRCARSARPGWIWLGGRCGAGGRRRDPRACCCVSSSACSSRARAISDGSRWSPARRSPS